MDTIRPTIKYSVAQECPEGCSIGLKNNQFDANSKYLVLEGAIDVEYMGEAKISVQSPYNNFSAWMEYSDNWNYGKTVRLSSKTTGEFLELSATQIDEANTPAPLHIQVYKLNNESISKLANTESFILVRGDSFVLDGQSANTQKVVRIMESRVVEVSSTGYCKVVYIEKA